MRDIYDLGERIQYFPILLGEVARQVRENQDILMDIKLYEGDVIEWGLPKKQVTPEVISFFKMWNFKENDKGFEYTFEHIPVQIVVFGGDYKFLNNTDTKFYKVDEYRLPNPWDEYWENRAII